ncbi:hypothetical protein MCC02041_00270 [Faecalibacterium prausnitzii]|nr:hypothetical protein MCC02041_00270 [Faecalibacterium prausnitzii]
MYGGAKKILSVRGGLEPVGEAGEHRATACPGLSGGRCLFEQNLSGVFFGCSDRAGDKSFDGYHEATFTRNNKDSV